MWTLRYVFGWRLQEILFSISYHPFPSQSYGSSLIAMSQQVSRCFAFKSFVFCCIFCSKCFAHLLNANELVRLIIGPESRATMCHSVVCTCICVFPHRKPRCAVYNITLTQFKVFNDRMIQTKLPHDGTVYNTLLHYAADPFTNRSFWKRVRAHYWWYITVSTPLSQPQISGMLCPALF